VLAGKDGQLDVTAAQVTEQVKEFMTQKQFVTNILQHAPTSKRR